MSGHHITQELYKIGYLGSKPKIKLTEKDIERAIEYLKDENFFDAIPFAKEALKSIK